MKTRTGLHNTILIIIHSLFPAGVDASPCTHPAGPRPHIIPSRDIRTCIGCLGHSNHSLNLLFPHARGIAAPFLLFRLKRLGFSNCRIVVTQDGLSVTADR